MITLVNNEMTKAFLGTTEVKKICLGSEQVWPVESGISYETVAYIENTGKAYIDTGFIPNGNTRVIIDFTPTGYTSVSGSSGFATIFGSGNRINSDAFILFMNTSTRMQQPQYYNTYANLKAMTYNTRYVVDFNKNVCTGISTKTFTKATFVCPTTLAIGYLKGRTFHQPKMKIHSCQVYDDGVLIRKYIPKLRNDGIYGLWDDVEGVFYTSPNGALFTGGN